jgi:RNA polymerase sigma-70 factor (ECF subfamily)
VSTPESTCWTVIRAAAGSSSDREELARRYLGTVRAYLAARWRDSPLRDHLEDATQEMFVECFRDGGAIEATGAGGVPEFRAFLYGVVRNVARRFESRPARAASPLPEIAIDDDVQSRLFDRTWAQALMAEAARLQRRRADEGGPEAVERVDLIRLRFEADRPTRDIAELWKTDAARLHRVYALAQKEFRAALLAVVGFHHPGTPVELEREAARLLDALA